MFLYFFHRENFGLLRTKMRSAKKTKLVRTERMPSAKTAPAWLNEVGNPRFCSACSATSTTFLPPGVSPWLWRRARVPSRQKTSPPRQLRHSSR